MRTTYEYAAICLPAVPFKRKGSDEPINDTDMLNDWGAQGWECFAVVEHKAYLRRVVLPPEPEPAPVPAPVQVQVVEPMPALPESAQPDAQQETPSNVQ